MAFTLYALLGASARGTWHLTCDSRSSAGTGVRGRRISPDDTLGDIALTAVATVLVGRLGSRRVPWDAQRHYLPTSVRSCGIRAMVAAWYLFRRRIATATGVVGVAVRLSQQHNFAFRTTTQRISLTPPAFTALNIWRGASSVKTHSRYGTFLAGRTLWGANIRRSPAAAPRTRRASIQHLLPPGLRRHSTNACCSIPPVRANRWAGRDRQAVTRLFMPVR